MFFYGFSKKKKEDPVNCNVICLVFAFLIGGCASMPSPAPYYKTDSGCKINQYPPDLIENGIEKITWDGPCDENGAVGRGNLIVFQNDGQRVTYSGEMGHGYIRGNGDLTFPSGLRLNGILSGELLVLGDVYRPQENTKYSGTMAWQGVDSKNVTISLADQRYETGSLYFLNRPGTYIKDAEFDLSTGAFTGVDNINLDTGRGLIYGSVFINEKLAYQIIKGKKYDNKDQYEANKNAYLQLKNEQLRQQSIRLEAEKRRLMEEMDKNIAKMEEDQRKIIEDERQRRVSDIKEGLSFAASILANRYPTSNERPQSSNPAYKTETAGTNAIKIHDPAGEATNCLRANTEKPYGGFTNICSFPVSYIHCIQNPTSTPGDSSHFNCQRPGGLWATSQPPGSLGPGRTEATSLNGGGQVLWIACKSPYSVRDAKFEGGRLQGKCIRF